MSTDPLEKALDPLPKSDKAEVAVSTSQSLFSLIITGAIMLAIVFGVRAYIAKPFIVSGLSMYPTFDSWHYLIINEFTYNFSREPQRGEVIVFHYPGDTSRFFIKRVIGLPGETVTLEGHAVSILQTNGTSITLDEPYVSDEKKKKSDIKMTLQDDEYFVLGDNRKESADSRYWGPLKREYIVGSALVRLFPFSMIDVTPGKTEYTY